VSKARRNRRPAAARTAPGTIVFAAARPAAAPPAPAGHPPDDQIRLLAYRKWEAAGRPPGDGVEFWCAAERELRGRGSDPT
jgi:hypothetical protein